MLLIKQVENLSQSQFRARFKCWGGGEGKYSLYATSYQISARKGIATLFLLLLSSVRLKMNSEYTLRKLGQCTCTCQVAS